MLSDINKPIMLSGVIPNVIMLSVVAPKRTPEATSGQSLKLYNFQISFFVLNILLQTVKILS
jgi:hypothetical protein